MRRVMVLAVSVLLVLALAPGAAAKSGGMERPVWSNLSGEVNFPIVGVPGVDACPVHTVSDAYGEMSHLGRVHMHSVHCPPVTLPVYTDMHMTITAANGDTLTATYDINGAGPYPLDITGGTGRFAGATGHLTFTFQVEGEWGANGLPISPWHGWWQMRGTINY